MVASASGFVHLANSELSEMMGVARPLANPSLIAQFAGVGGCRFLRHR
jgi:hypothetical protein